MKLIRGAEYLLVSDTDTFSLDLLCKTERKDHFSEWIRFPSVQELLERLFVKFLVS